VAQRLESKAHDEDGVVVGTRPDSVNGVGLAAFGRGRVLDPPLLGKCGWRSKRLSFRRK